MQSPPVPRYLVTPRSKYSPQHHVLKHPQPPFLPQCQRPSFTPTQVTYILYKLIDFNHIVMPSFRITEQVGAASGNKATQLDRLFLNAPISFETPVNTRLRTGPGIPEI